MRIRTSLIGLLPVLAFAPGCSEPMLFSAEIDVPDVCVSGLRVPFPPADFQGNTDTPISADDLGMPDSDGFELAITVRAVGLTPVEGVTDLGFLDSLTVSASPADPASGLGELMLVQMDEADHTAEGAMYAEPEQQVDIAEHLVAGDVFFRFGLSGDLPDILWVADMDLCVHAVASYEKPL